MTTPPSQDPISQIYLSDTFYTWYKKTNDLITKVNPIEVYSITADTEYGSDGITLSDGGDGNWTIGYVLPADITGDHGFSGNIVFGDGVSGNIVNKYNGLTGSVIGVSTISNTYTPSGTAGNVTGVPMIINGVTASTGGVMTLDASDIPNTISSITGPAGSIIVSSGDTMDSVSRLFFYEPSSGISQQGLVIDPDNEQVVIAGSTVDDDGYKLTIQGGNSGGIKIYGTPNEANDIQFGANGAMRADANLYVMSGDENKISFLSGPDGATYGGCNEIVKINGDADGAGTTCMEVGISDSHDHTAIMTHADYVNGGFDLSMADRGGIASESSMNFHASGQNSGSTLGGHNAAFHFRYGSDYETDNDMVFALNRYGGIGLIGGGSGGGTPDFGSDGQVIVSKGLSAKPEWVDADFGGGGGGGGANITMFDQSKDLSEDNATNQLAWDGKLDDCGQIYNRTDETSSTLKTFNLTTNFAVPSEANYAIITVHTWASFSTGDWWTIYALPGDTDVASKRKPVVQIRGLLSDDGNGYEVDTNTVWVPIVDGKISLYKHNTGSGPGPDDKITGGIWSDGCVAVIDGYAINGAGNGGANTASKIQFLNRPIDWVTGGSVNGIFDATDMPYTENDTGEMDYKILNLADYGIPVDATHLILSTYIETWDNNNQVNVSIEYSTGTSFVASNSWDIQTLTTPFTEGGGGVATSTESTQTTVPVDSEDFAAVLRISSVGGNAAGMKAVIAGYIVPATGGVGMGGHNTFYFENGPRYIDGGDVLGSEWLEGINNSDVTGEIKIEQHDYLSEDNYNLFEGGLGIPTNADFLILQTWYAESDLAGSGKGKCAYYLAGDASSQNPNTPIDWQKKYAIADGTSIGGGMQTVVPIDPTGWCRFGVNEQYSSYPSNATLKVNVLGYIVNGALEGDVGIDLHSLNSPVKLDTGVSVGNSERCSGGTVIDMQDGSENYSVYAKDTTFNAITDAGLPSNTTHVMLSCYYCSGNHNDFSGSVRSTAGIQFDQDNAIEILGHYHSNDNALTNDHKSWFSSKIIPVSQSSDSKGAYTIRVTSDKGATEGSAGASPLFDYYFQIDGYIVSGGVTMVDGDVGGGGGGGGGDGHGPSRVLLYDEENIPSCAEVEFSLPVDDNDWQWEDFVDFDIQIHNQVMAHDGWNGYGPAGPVSWNLQYKVKTGTSVSGWKDNDVQIYSGASWANSIKVQGCNNLVKIRGIGGYSYTADHTEFMYPEFYVENHWSGEMFDHFDNTGVYGPVWSKFQQTQSGEPRPTLYAMRLEGTGNHAFRLCKFGRIQVWGQLREPKASSDSEEGGAGGANTYWVDGWQMSSDGDTEYALNIPSWFEPNSTHYITLHNKISVDYYNHPSGDVVWGIMQGNDVISSNEASFNIGPISGGEGANGSREYTFKVTFGNNTNDVKVYGDLPKANGMGVDATQMFGDYYYWH